MFNFDIWDIKSVIVDIMKEECVCMLQRQIDVLDKEEKQVQEEIDWKYGQFFFIDRKYDFIVFVNNFFFLFGNVGFLEYIMCVLMLEEIVDLKIVFDLFDVKGRGYLNVFQINILCIVMFFEIRRVIDID